MSRREFYLVEGEAGLRGRELTATLICRYADVIVNGLSLNACHRYGRWAYTVTFPFSSQQDIY